MCIRDRPNTGAEETLNIKTGVLRDMIERTLYAVSQEDVYKRQAKASPTRGGGIAKQ